MMAKLPRHQEFASSRYLGTNQESRPLAPASLQLQSAEFGTFGGKFFQTGFGPDLLYLCDFLFPPHQPRTPSFWELQ